MLVLLSLIACTQPVQDTGEEEGLHGELSSIDSMRVLELWGTREEMGYAEGALMCEEMVEVFRLYILEHLVAEYDVPYELVRLMAENSVTIPEGDLRELEALYQGALDTCTTEQLTVTSEYLEPAAGGSRQMDFIDLVAVNALADFACSSFSVWGDLSVTGDTLYGRNFDWAVDPDGAFLDAHILKVYDSEEEGRFASVGVGGLIGCISCFTQEGIGLNMHNIYEPLDPDQVSDNTPRMLATRKALVSTLGASDPVAQAEAALEAEPLRAASNLHMPMPLVRGGDRGAVVLEVDGNTEHPDGECTVREAGYDAALPENALVNTNHYVQRTEPMTDADSRGRYDTLVQGILDAPEPLDLDDAHDLLASVGVWATLHTIVYEASTKEMWIYVSEEAGQPATDYSPTELRLGALWEE